MGRREEGKSSTHREEDEKVWEKYCRRQLTRPHLSFPSVFLSRTLFLFGISRAVRRYSLETTPIQIISVYQTERGKVLCFAFYNAKSRRKGGGGYRAILRALVWSLDNILHGGLHGWLAFVFCGEVSDPHEDSRVGIDNHHIIVLQVILEVYQLIVFVYTFFYI